MIIVHDTFICKPGNASKVAKMFKESMGSHENVLQIMTDMTGQYNKVVMVSQYEDLSAYDDAMRKMMSGEGDKQMKKDMAIMKGYQEMYQTGSREIYRVW